MQILPGHAATFTESPGREAFNTGVAAFINKDNETAVEHLATAIAADPELDEVHYVLGLALLRLGREDEAVAALQHTVAHTENVILRDYAVKKLAVLGIN